MSRSSLGGVQSNGWDFEPDRGFIPIVLKHQDTRRLVMEKAEEAVARARRPAPRGFRRRTGENVTKMRTYSTMGPDDALSKDDRWVAHVEMFAPHAAVREFGTPNAYLTPHFSAPEAVLRSVAREISSPDP